MDITYILDPVPRIDPRKAFCCPRCNQTFTYWSNLTRHVRYLFSCASHNISVLTPLVHPQIDEVHLGLRREKCPLCPTRLRKSSIPRHINSCHNSANKFKCGLCMSTFSSSSLRKKHFNSEHHTGTQHMMPGGLTTTPEGTNST